MFIETHTNGVTLTFIKSENVQVFPSGRRGAVIKDNTTIPFDPEARLNTEANNRKQSGLSGYTQEYLKDWNNEHLIISLAGYLFDINLATGYTDKDTFGSKIIEKLAAKVNSLKAEAGGDTEAVANLEAMLNAINNATAIYANILIEDVPLYSGEPKKYFTRILRNQAASDSDKPEPYLDLLCTALADQLQTNPNVAQNFDNYYFSGLSFSVTPLTTKSDSSTYNAESNLLTRETVAHSRKEDAETVVNQQIVSLRILEKVKTSTDGVTPEVWEWKIHQPAYLPKIEHGTTEDSIVVDETRVRENLTVDKDAEIRQNLTITGRVEVTDETTKVKNKFVVKNDVEVLNNKITTKDLESTDTIFAKNIGTSASKVTKVTAKEASIEAINADDIQQKVTNLTDWDNGYYKVPVVFLKQDGDEYQLQITRVNKPSVQD